MKTTVLARVLLVLFAATLLCASVRPAAAGEYSLYLKSGWFGWDEELNRAPFVRERGAMSGAGITRTDLFGLLSLSETGEVWGGYLDYDGHDLTGTTRVESDTSYLGTREEVEVGVKLPAGSLSLMPFGGIGHRFWVRTRSNEDWNSIYGKAGLAVELPVGRSILFLKGGGLYPFYNRSHVSLSNSGYTDVVTEPKSLFSAFGEAGVRVSAFAVSVEYERWKFGRSDAVPISRVSAATGAVIENGVAFQPDSKSDQVSLKLSYYF